MTKINPEDPTRLRRCLTMLAATAGSDMTVVEFAAAANGNTLIYVTSSREESEEGIALAIAKALQLDVVKSDADGKAAP